MYGRYGDVGEEKKAKYIWILFRIHCSREVRNTWISANSRNSTETTILAVVIDLSAALSLVFNTTREYIVAPVNKIIRSREPIKYPRCNLETLAWTRKSWMKDSARVYPGNFFDVVGTESPWSRIGVNPGYDYVPDNTKRQQEHDINNWLPNSFPEL